MDVWLMAPDVVARLRAAMVRSGDTAGSGTACTAAMAGRSRAATGLTPDPHDNKLTNGISLSSPALLTPRPFRFAPGGPAAPNRVLTSRAAALLCAWSAVPQTVA